MADNPWLVDSLQTFWQLKCPECTFDSKEEDIFKYHAVTKHPLSLALFAKEFDYSVTVNNQSLGSIKTEVSQENLMSPMFVKYEVKCHLNYHFSLIGKVKNES